jgi:hypothetical protein
MPVRGVSGRTGDTHWAQFPLTPLSSVLVIGREGGPSYLRSEMVHGERVIALAVKALCHVLQSDTRIENLSELTACLAHPSRSMPFAIREGLAAW